VNERGVLVTGATGTIGSEVVRAFAAAGDRLALLARRPAPLDAAAGRARHEGAAAVATAAADLRDPERLPPAVERVAQAVRPLDIVVHAAGASPRGGFEAVSLADWQNAFAVKLFSAWQLVRACRPHLAVGASVVFVIGESGHQPDPDFTLGAANAALVHLTKTMAATLGREGIRVNAVSPGPVAGHRFVARVQRHATDEDPRGERFEAAFKEDLPLRRLVEPVDVARAVEYLARADAVTGEVLSVSAGRSARRL
jgi:NAD(P)-dependent dehydrogenase (short-subunit alcohol dehydrogenase family)